MDQLDLAISADVKSLCGKLLKMTFYPVCCLFSPLGPHWLLEGRLFDSTPAKSWTISPHASLQCQTGPDEIEHI